MVTMRCEDQVFTFEASDDPQLSDDEWTATIHGVRYTVQVLSGGTYGGATQYGPAVHEGTTILYLKTERSLKLAMKACVEHARANSPH